MLLITLGILITIFGYIFLRVIEDGQYKKLAPLFK